MGDLDTSSVDGFEKDFEMDCVHIHKGYVVANQQNPSLGVIDHYANDIALIKLHTSPDNYITVSAEVMPACLPEKDEFQPGAECFVTGWGYTGMWRIYLVTIVWNRRPFLVSSRFTNPPPPLLARSLTLSNTQHTYFPLFFPFLVSIILGEGNIGGWDGNRETEYIMVNMQSLYKQHR